MVNTYIILHSNCLWPCSLAITSTGWVGLWFCGLYTEQQKKRIFCTFDIEYKFRG